MAGPLVVIVGSTASGKSQLALEIAKQFDGEIICADSRTVYRGMDIGTAKPSVAEQNEIRHHLLDIVEPSQTFTAAQFKELALSAIEDIESRKKLPIIVGGTGLYIDALLFDYGFSDSKSARDPKNPRHLRPDVAKIKSDIRSNTLVIGLDVAKEKLAERITKRVEAMLRAGLKAEVRNLAKKYGWEAPGLSAVGYKEWHSDNPEAEIIKNTLQYAKRQRTWFRRNTNIKWVKNGAEALGLVKTFLQK